MVKIAAACCAEIPGPATVGVVSSVSRSCGLMCPPPAGRAGRLGMIDGGNYDQGEGDYSVVTAVVMENLN